jgi:hypothetical protein
MDKSFSDRCAAANTDAWNKSHPFVPSRAQLEEALEPLLRDLALMGSEAAWEYIGQTFKIRGLMPLAVRMYKDSTGVTL